MRIVIKIGTSTIAHKTGRLNIRISDRLTEIISDIINEGNEVVIVSSGAIGMGVGKLGLPGRPDDIAGKQAAAAVGQCELMYTYDRLFARYNHTVAQILLTASDFTNADRHGNFTNTVGRLLEFGAVPVINENDTVATEEIKLGDNDTLSAKVAVSVKADLLILLSDIDGLYTADPHKDSDAKLIRTVDRIDDALYAIAGGKGSSLGTGGMKTKLDAAAICLENGCDMVIANGSDPDVLYRILDGTEEKCTLFKA
ncbi:MAG: glutamate 5-kinase [Clostridia bacterium]|nr:glutamate 5-kinase [Clostridia bacterium]